MEITPTTTGHAGGAATKPAGSATGAAATPVSGDFETFLTLLTTQMRNQDPLKPMDSTEFVAQLASFSSVEQQIRANERLDGILGVLSGGRPSGLAEWIGREVRVAAKAEFIGEPVEVAVSPAPGADRAELVVRNDFGQVVARVATARDATAVTWDGRDDRGNLVAEGRYGFELESHRGSALIDRRAGQIYSPVQEVRLVDGAPTLVVADGSQVPLAEIGGVR